MPIVIAQYVASVLPPTASLHDFSEGCLKHLPRFNGETRPSVEYHLATFLDFADNMNIK